MRRPPLCALALLALPALALHGQSQKPATLARFTRSSQQPAADLTRGVDPRDVIHEALSYLGVPYVHGGASRDGLDCSGLVYRVLMDTAALSVPRGVEALFRSGSEATYPLHLGDLLFFDTDGPEGHPRIASHVGIYAGEGRFVHAASEGSHTGVIVSSLDNPYYHDRFLGARRLIPWRKPVLDVVLTDESAQMSAERPFPSRETMAIEIFNKMTGGGPMDLTIRENGRQVYASRIAPGATGPVVIPLTPDVGVWDVRVNRLFRGRELGRVTFTVEE